MDCRGTCGRLNIATQIRLCSHAAIHAWRSYGVCPLCDTQMTLVRTNLPTFARPSPPAPTDAPDHVAAPPTSMTRAHMQRYCPRLYRQMLCMERSCQPRRPLYNLQKGFVTNTHGDDDDDGGGEIMDEDGGGDGETSEVAEADLEALHDAFEGVVDEEVEAEVYRPELDRTTEAAVDEDISVDDDGDDNSPLSVKRRAMGVPCMLCTNSRAVDAETPCYVCTSMLRQCAGCM